MKAIGAVATLLLLVAVLTSALGVVWTRHESRVLFVSLTALQNQRDELNIEFGKLELEQATKADPSRINAEAREKLGMVDPRPQDVRLLR